LVAREQVGFEVVEWFGIVEVAEPLLFDGELLDPVGEVVQGGLGFVAPFLADVKAAAAGALEDGEAVAFSMGVGCPEPDVEHDSMVFGGAAVGMKDLAAGGIGSSENHGNPSHFSGPLYADVPDKPVRNKTRRRWTLMDGGCLGCVGLRRNFGLTPLFSWCSLSLV
jgi:hypothetical protein